jgi:hypothetical protein
MAEAQYHVPPEEPDGEMANGKMGFLEHLDELRTRLIRSWGIGIAWIVAPRRQSAPANRTRSRDLKLVFAATIIDQTLRQRRRSQSEFPRMWRGTR